MRGCFVRVTESRTAELQNNPPLVTAPLHTSVQANWTRSWCLSAGFPAAPGASSTLLHFHVRGRPLTCPETACPTTGPTSAPDRLSLFSDPDISSALYCLVVFGCILTLYYGCLLYVKTVTFSTVTRHPHASPPLLT